jgi:hypothetical protein
VANGNGGAGHSGVVPRGREVGGFRAYDCANATNRVDVYSLLEPGACPSATSHHAAERTILSETVKIKSKRRVPVF